MAFDFNLKKLSQREKKLVGIFIVILSTLPFFQSTFPTWNKYMELINKNKDDKVRFSQLESQITRLEKLKKESLELSKKLEEQKLYLAKSYEIDFLVQDLKKICDENAISLDSFTPINQEPVNIVLEKQTQTELQGRTRSRQKLKQAFDKLMGQDLPIDLYRFPIEVRVAGDFTDIVGLFDKLEKYGRVISVDNISIGKIEAKTASGDRLSKSKPKKEKVDTSTLLSTFDLVAYSLPSKEERLSLNQLEKSTMGSGSAFNFKKSSKRR